MRYLFADCLLDTQLYTLSRAGLATSLQPKVFQALRYLLEHRDHLVSKEELCAHVWPAQFISDATIEGCIKRARQAIGDTGRAQQLIQTRRGYGYRFVGRVEEGPETPLAQEPTVTLRLSPAAQTQDDIHRRPDPARLPEEDPVAVSAGAASRSGDPAAEPLAACLGLHTGLMVMGGIGDAQGTTTVVGDLTLAVEALQERAAPGMLLCSEATARLVRGGVRLEEVTPVPVPGQPAPVRIYQVMGLYAQDISRAQVELRVRSPFVGRTHELATLHAVMAQVVGGRGQAVGIVGEPGIGKSRLLVEWHQRLRAHGVAYLEGHCLSYGSATPYLPVLDWLRAHCGITPADGDDAITAKVRGRLQVVGLTPGTAAPYLLHLLGVEAATVQVAGISPDTLKAHTFATLRQFWLKSSQQHPLILVVEDLHWR